MKAETFAILTKKAQYNFTQKDTLLDYIVETVNTYYHIINNIEYCRKRHYVLARQISHYFAKELHPRLSLAFVGKNIGNKDHATVLHSIKTINNLIDTDKVFAAEIEEIKTLLKITL